MAYRVCLLLLLLLSGAPEKGALKIQSEPGAEVEWEGVVLGATDESGVLIISDIPVGEYSVTLRKKGYREARATARVTAGETLLRVTLQRLRTAAEPRRAAEPVPSQSRATEPTPPPMPAPAAQQESPATTPDTRLETRTQEAAGKAGFDSRPDPEAPEVVPADSDIAAPREAAPADGSVKVDPAEEVGSFSTLYLLLAAVLAVTALLLARGKRRIPRDREYRLQAELLEGRPPTDQNGGTTFLADLKQREASIASATRYENGREVIEVEVTDVEILDEDT